MAYMNSERKAKLVPAIKAACKKYGIKATVGVRNHSTLVINISQGKIDFIANTNEVCGRNHSMVCMGFKPITRGCLDVNPYHFNTHFDGQALKFLTELFAAANAGNHDRSDIMTDYHDVGWYVDVNVGKWNKAYVVTK